MAVASAWPWRRAWMRPRGSGGHDTDDGGGSLPPTGGDSTTSGTTYTASTTTTTTDSGGEPRPRDLHPFTAPVVGENTEELYVAKELAEDVAKKLEHIKGLVVEFSGDDSTAVQTWLSELDVGWVLHLAGTHESSWSVVTSHGFQFLVETWILALRKIGESILTSLDGWYSQSQSQRQDQDEGARKQPSPSEFAELVQATVLKMLPFVDIAAAAKTTDRPGALAPAEKLQALIDMHDALSMASQHILPLHVESTDGAMEDFLSADLTKLDEAIWATIVEIMNIVMAWAWKWSNDRVSSDIHKVMKSIVSYTKVLWANYGSVNRILDDAVLRGEFVPENENVSHVSNLIVEMVSSTTTNTSFWTSSSFLDERLRFLFLINNFYYLLQELRTIRCLGFIMEPLIYKVDDYIDSYLHESWAPVLKCLQDPFLPCCLTRYPSPLPKFESKFQKTFATQKLWKVPDPEMRRRLRKAVADKVIPAFTQFLEDNHTATPPGFTPRKLEKMLGELFQG
ncbi:unnamed protein product [Miscanthus lutarioriparius]|uniref:Exocyst subunit Exo70 family protein n=1 Tax=Miscanthus lutarioriparius TaxID=422564 RepID=A0A811RZ72_9POAL|nr:unnamed protein product [Miscanthus lutarioriparius]